MLYAKIKKKFGSFNLDVEFETNEEILALLGSSGCGKSMTLKCIAGVETPDEGQIILNGRILFDSKKKINLLSRDRKVGLLFQNYALFPNMTLKENIAIGFPKKHPNKDGVIKDKIKAFSLEGLENNYPHQLSGGQQQRVALARMLVNEPEILMLDEPFSALDEYLKWQMEQELISILKEHRGSTLYVSHNKGEVYRICDKIAVMNNGRIEEINNKETLFTNPQTFNTATLTGCKNISKAKKICENTVYAIDWDLRLICNDKVKDDIQYIGIHSHNIKPCSNLQSENSFELEIRNKVESLFLSTLILANTNATSSNSNIYMDISKENLYKYDGSVKSTYVNFSKENLLLLY